MTQIHISIRKPKTGGLDPVTGTLRFRPVRRHFDAAKNLISMVIMWKNRENIHFCIYKKCHLTAIKRLFPGK